MSLRRALRASPGSIVLLFAAIASVGPDCVGGGSPVSLAPSPVVLQVPVGAVQTFDLLMQSTVPIQAFELEVDVDPPNLLVLGLVEPHPGFDDDGKLFVPPVLDVFAGRVSRIVDFRHGAALAPGTAGIVRLSVYAVSPGDVTVRFQNARFAQPDGSTVSLGSAPATIQIVAP
jgi:hypothetical protein